MLTARIVTPVDAVADRLRATYRVSRGRPLTPAVARFAARHEVRRAMGAALGQQARRLCAACGSVMTPADEPCPLRECPTEPWRRSGGRA